MHLPHFPSPYFILLSRGDKAVRLGGDLGLALGASAVYCSDVQYWDGHGRSCGAVTKVTVTLVGSVSVDTTKVADKTIVVVDDLYQSGLTISYIAEELRQAGAKEVFGLAAVKTLRNDDNLPKFAASKYAVDDSDDEFPF
jgi:hypoxanthine phosphoribosyltransferase